MNLGLYDFGDGGGVATKWQRQHAARKRAEAAKRHRAEAAANKKKVRAEARADLKKRLKKWRKGHLAKCAAAKAAGLPKPGTQGKPWRMGLENSQVIDMTGWTFGRLTVIRSAPISLTMRTAQRCRCWIVKCSCGSPERIVNGTSLRQGNSNSCGCLLREWATKLGRAQRGKIKSHPLSVKLLLEAKAQRAGGNVRLARLLELSIGAVRRRERRAASKKRKRRSRR